MKKGYAYIDKSGVLHVVKDIQTAIDYAMKGTKVIETEIEYEMGYPLSGGEQVIAYSDVKMKHSADGDDIVPVSAVSELYNLCRG